MNNHQFFKAESSIEIFVFRNLSPRAKNVTNELLLKFEKSGIILMVMRKLLVGLFTRDHVFLARLLFLVL